METMVKRFLSTGALAAFATMTILATPGQASAEEVYTDADSEYMRVVSRVVQPVGIVLEAVVFRPFTALMSWSDPNMMRAERAEHPRECYGQRPHRACSKLR